MVLPDNCLARKQISLQRRGAIRQHTFFINLEQSQSKAYV
jgi:hypothetical protein